MTTKLEKPLEVSQTTHVADMPPLEVVTEGIPLEEHVEFATAAQPRPVVREGWGRMWALALAGVMGLLLLVAGVFAYLQSTLTGGPGATFVPPVGSEVAEPASEVYSGPLEGPALPYIPYLFIRSIPPIADISIEPISAISPMPEISIPPMPEISIPSIPDLSIPSIPPIDFTATPTTPTTPTTTVISIPDMSIPSIEFPSFPSIPSISVPSIRPIPAISIPPFPTISIPQYSDL